MSKRTVFLIALIALNLVLMTKAKTAMAAEESWRGTCGYCWGNGGSTEPCCQLGCSLTTCCTGPEGCN